jgi:hypothetical protein
MTLHLVTPRRLYAGNPRRGEPESLKSANSEAGDFTFENAGKFTLPDTLDPAQSRYFIINALLSIIGWMRAQGCDDLRLTLTHDLQPALTHAAFLRISVNPIPTQYVYSVCIFRMDSLRTSAETIVGHPNLLNPEDPIFWTFHSFNTAELAEYLRKFLRKTLHMFARTRRGGHVAELDEPKVRLIFEPDDKTEPQHNMPEIRSRAIKSERSPSPLALYLLKNAERFRSPRHIVKRVARSASRRKRALPGH